MFCLTHLTEPYISAVLYHRGLVCVKSGFLWSVWCCGFCGVKAARTKLRRTLAHRQTANQSAPGVWGFGCLTEVILSIGGSMWKILCSSALVWFLELFWLLKWSDTEASSPASTCAYSMHFYKCAKMHDLSWLLARILLIPPLCRYKPHRKERFQIKP